MAIHDSALGLSFRGNWNHEHFKCSAVHWEARRRHIAAGHAKDCRGGTIYSQAYNDVARSQGHSERPIAACTCSEGGIPQRGV